MFRAWPVRLLAPALAVPLLAAPDARADGQLSSGEFSLQVGGYAELTAAYFDHDANQNQPGGARRDDRVELDTTRLVAEVEAMGPGKLELEVEFEFEHGGVGAAREIEYEEFGEFETEVEKGGEIVLEEFVLKKSWGRYQAAIGRFYVPVGMLSTYYKPTDYLGTIRSEAETTVLPAQWDEMGAMVSAMWPRVRVTAALVNGLDSSGFSSKLWISPGHQGAYESIRARDPALAARVDVDVTRELEVGASGYVGGTNNRPKPDLIRQGCADEDATDEVAPCGYIHAPVVIGDVHARYAGRQLHASAWAMLGHLTQADKISARNARLSNEAGVARTPVGDNALAIAAEVGLDVAPWLGLCPGRTLEPFARLDYVDTMFRPRADLFDNPRFARLIVGAGVAHRIGRGVIFKADVSRRQFAGDDLRAELTVRASAGVWF